jgi:RIP metalloprotease RseP
VVNVNGKALSLSKQPTTSEAQKGISDFIRQIRAVPEGSLLDLTVLRPGSATPVQISFEPKTSSSGTRNIGVLLQPNFNEVELLKTSNIPEAAGLAYQYATNIITETATGLASAVGDLVTGNAGASGASLSGPIGLIKTGTDILATEDYRTALLFTAALSINLGVLNAFPVPALDGGQLIFVLVEAATGRRVNQRVQESITGATLVFLLLISAGAAFGDLETIFVGGR